jgi:hypothetical protein
MKTGATSSHVKAQVLLSFLPDIGLHSARTSINGKYAKTYGNALIMVSIISPATPTNMIHHDLILLVGLLAKGVLVGPPKLPRPYLRHPSTRPQIFLIVDVAPLWRRLYPLCITFGAAHLFVYGGRLPAAHPRNPL